ncbi:MAG: hypothetical protein V1701_00515 [Planctomycetota bacterium]
MIKVKKGTEIWVKTPNKIGVAAGLARVVSTTKTNILAMSSYGETNKGYFKLVTSNNAKAAKAIKTLGYNVKQNNVLLVETPNNPSTFWPLAQKIAKRGVNINYCYGTAMGAKALLVLSTNNNAKAITALR